MKQWVQMFSAKLITLSKRKKQCVLKKKGLTITKCGNQSFLYKRYVSVMV